MLRSRRTAAGWGALGLVLAVGCWVTSESGAGASAAEHAASAGSAKQGRAHPVGAFAKTVTSPQSAASAKTAGAKGAPNSSAKSAGLLGKLENKLQREEAELKKLEQSLENLLDDGGDGNQGQGAQGASPTSSSGSSPGASPSASQPNSSTPYQHNRRGRMWRGMELAKLTHELHRAERLLAHLEKDLGRELAGLRDLDRNLRNLDRLGQRTGLGLASFARSNQAGNGKWQAETRSAKSGKNSPSIGQAHAGAAAAPASHTPNTSHGSHALAGARGVGNKMAGQQPHPANHHH